MASRPRPPRAGDFPAGRELWNTYFLRQVPEYVWPIGHRVPARMFERLQEDFPLEWLRRQYHGVTAERYNELLGFATTALRHRLQVHERALERPATVMERHQEIFPFANLDDNAFREATLRGQTGRLTRRAVAAAERQYIHQEDGVPPGRGHGLYHRTWRYTIAPNNLDLRANLMALYNRMGQNIQPNHRYRIRMAWNVREAWMETFRDKKRQTRVYNGPADWFSPQGFEDFYDAFVNMFISNEQIPIFEVEFFLDERPIAAGHDPSPAEQGEIGQYGGPWRSDFPRLQNRGLFFVPKRVDNLCGWMVLTVFLLDESGPKQIRHKWTAAEKTQFPQPQHPRVDTWLATIKSLKSLTHKKSNGNFIASQDRWMLAARQLKDIVSPGSANEFVVDRDCDLFVAKFPKYKIQVFGAGRDTEPFYTAQGAQYELGNVRHDPYQIFVSFDIWFDTTNFIDVLRSVE